MKPFQAWLSAPEPAVTAKEVRTGMEKIRILLVDDQQNNLFALETLLGDSGYELVRATSGAEALRCVLEKEFALILLDVLMPGMDGFETAELIRKRRQSAHTPIIFITATSTNESHVGQGYSLGAVDYIYKPIVPEILKAKVLVFADLYRKTRSLARSEEALRAELAARRESEEKYRKLFARASDAIIVFDADGGTVVDVNKAALELYGYAEAEFLKLASGDLEAEPETIGKGSKSEKNRKQSFMRFHKKADGRVFPAEVTSAGISLKGRKLIMVLTRDITERLKAAEAELLREREEMQRQLVATVSHELRTPIAAIKASAETLSLGEMENERTRTRFLKIIENQANRLGGLVEDLLLVAELESGKCKPVTSAIPLAGFVKELLPAISVLAKKKSVSISAKIDPKLVVLADRSHLTGIFQNLLDNAIKYNKKNGSIEITAMRNDAGEAQVSVRDTGIGIPAADLPLIFQQFHRAPSVRELCIKGTGLGLYIIKTMVDSNLGRIWAECPDDEGTIFSFTLPLEEA
jgi:PAS domain S-box-containing protein